MQNVKYGCKVGTIGMVAIPITNEMTVVDAYIYNIHYIHYFDQPAISCIDYTYVVYAIL